MDDVFDNERVKESTLKLLTREGLLSQEQFLQLNQLKDLDLPQVADIIKGTKIGQGIRFLPTTLSELKKKLGDSLEELVRTGLTNVKKDVHAVLDELLRRNDIPIEQYIALKEDNNLL